MVVAVAVVVAAPVVVAVVVAQLPGFQSRCRPQAICRWIHARPKAVVVAVAEVDLAAVVVDWAVRLRSSHPGRTRSHSRPAERPWIRKRCV